MSGGRPLHRLGPWKGIDDVEFATLEWVDWWNNRRLLEPIGDIPPAEFEAALHADRVDQVCRVEDEPRQGSESLANRSPGMRVRAMSSFQGKEEPGNVLHSKNRVSDEPGGSAYQ